MDIEIVVFTETHIYMYALNVIRIICTETLIHRHTPTIYIHTRGNVCIFVSESDGRKFSYEPIQTELSELFEQKGYRMQYIQLRLKIEMWQQMWAQSEFSFHDIES